MLSFSNFKRSELIAFIFMIAFIDIVEQTINLPPQFSENIPLVKYLPTFIPISHKHGLVNTLVFRCFKICLTL